MPSTWQVLLLATLACSLAGCTKSAPGAVAEPEASGVLGWVLDPLFMPIVDATVTVLETGNTTTTGLDGGYRLDLPPGRHTLQASAPGHLPVTRSVDVHTSALQNFSLDREPSQIYTRVHHFEGFIECSAFAKAGHSHGSGEPSDNPTDCGAYQASRSTWEVPIEAGADAIVVQVFWDKQTALAEHLLVILYQVTDDGSEYMTFQEGVSPIKVPVGSIEAADRFSQGGTLRVDVQIGGADQDVAAGAAVQQPFEGFTSVFHGQVAPVDYTV